VVEALSANEYVTPAEAEALRSSIAKPAEQTAAPDELADVEETSPEVEAAHKAFEQEHASEIAAEEGKPFELVKEEETTPEAGAAAAEEAAPVADAAPQEQVPDAAPPSAVAAALDEFEIEEQKRLTILQRVSKLNVGQRIKLGFIGNREERAILIRDTARLVQNAVLSSPKVTDAEVESFAGSKNLQENVFREIARQRRFIKLYPVVRNLVNNPKCPLDISLTLIKTLMVYDLKSLRHNKNVPDTIRKVAAKLYTEKATRGGKS
jgi:sRNA-binding protein